MKDQNENDLETRGSRPVEPLNEKISDGLDIKDSPHDEERMKREEVIMDLPDVKDIPGQEHIIPPRFREFSDVTVSSDDEEGLGLFDDEDDDDDVVMGTEGDVTATEQTLLQRADEDMPSQDESNLRQAALDDTDLEGDPINEDGFGKDVTGMDLDTSGVDADDAMENIGEEDEENNTYSLGDDHNDNVTEGTP
jgi:hypothetical protein